MPCLQRGVFVFSANSEDILGVFENVNHGHDFTM